MTVSTLAEIEACPRRWALTQAEYPDLWSGRGYPPRLPVNALAGSVAHLVLERIIRQLVEAGCSSVEDPAATFVLRELGGYTKLVHESIDRVLDRFKENPRASMLIESAQRTLRGQAPALRMHAQSMLARVRLSWPRSSTAAPRSVGSMRRGPLTGGIFPEIEMRASRIGWKGKADLLIVSHEACEIVDFKTGIQDDTHNFQLQVYALLWKIDEELNPTGRPVDRLVLSYESGDIEVAVPTATQLAQLEAELATRRDVARAAVTPRPPEARPGADNCRYCSVRQLCDRYWLPETQGAMVQGADHHVSDVELRIVRRHGSSSWDAIIVLSSALPAGKPALVRTTQAREMETSKHLRVLNATATVDPDDQDEPAIVTLGAYSEIFAVV